MTKLNFFRHALTSQKCLTYISPMARHESFTISTHLNNIKYTVAERK